MAEVPPTSTFAPLKHRAFAVLWLASLISNVGTWMFNVTSGWLMTELSPSPLMVSLVQASAALPMFLFALPAGALGDIFDRRKLLIVSQSLLAAALFVFALMLWQGVLNAWLLLLFTFLTGVGAAFSMAPWQAIVPKLVPKSILQEAIALNGISINIARAIGPALGGFVLAGMGAVATVFLDAISYLAVVAALLWWHSSTAATNALPRERLFGAMRAGIRFSLHSKPLKSTIVRAVAFFSCASAYWALLPLVAKDVFQGGPGLYGGLLTSIGCGAVMGAMLLPRIKRWLRADGMVAMGTLFTASALSGFSMGGNTWIGYASGVSAGVAWILVLSSLNVSAQMALPDWVRARGMAVFQMMFFGAMTIGSLAWGHIAGDIGVIHTFEIAALLALLSIPLTWHHKLNLSEHHDHTPSGHWPAPETLAYIAHDQGPVMITVEYEIADADRATFYTLMRLLSNVLLRDGATASDIFEDVEHPGRFIHVFTVDSWIAHLRQHARVSVATKTLQDRIRLLHRGDEPPHVRHAVMPDKGNHPLRLQACSHT